MSHSEFPQPSPEDLAGFTKGDPIAIDRVIRCILAPLCRWAWKQYSGLPREDVEGVVHECLAELARNHQRYDASQSLITTYVINLLKLRIQRVKLSVQKNQASMRKEREESSPRVYNEVDSGDLDRRIMRERFYEEVENTLRGADKDFFELMKQGAEPVEFVNLMQRAGYENPASEAKNRKARVQRKLKEIAKGMGIDPQDLME